MRVRNAQQARVQALNLRRMHNLHGIGRAQHNVIRPWYQGAHVKLFQFQFRMLCICTCACCVSPSRAARLLQSHRGRSCMPPCPQRMPWEIRSSHG